VGATPKRRRFRPVPWLQRVILGAMMTFVAFVVEKRLVKALRKERKPSGKEAEPAEEQDPDADVTTGYHRTVRR
jgi:hypothetical protein